MNLNFRRTALLVGICSAVSLTYTPQLFAASVDAIDAVQQAKKITGTVTDAMGPVIGANVLEKGTTNGVITDIDGNFTLNVQPGATIVVSFIGYQPQEIVVGNQTSFKIQLKEDAELLDEVVVVGYGVQKKKLVTGATVQVKGEDIAKLNTTSALGALQSQTPGVNITSNNGQPGEGFKVNIRGLGTIGDSAPLYVIDGVAGGDINTLNPADIESVDVLKDAASAAIYGSRAANGVILVTTKQGRMGKLEISYDGYVGWQNVYKMPDLLNAREYMAMQDEILFNEGQSMNNWESLLGSRVYGMVQDGWKGTDWFDAIREKDALTQNHAINLTGGNEMSKFSMGFSYTNQDGILGKPFASSYDRYTARINSDHVLLKGKDFDIIKIGENLNFSYSTKNGVGQGNQYGNDVYLALSACPLLPMYDAEGNLYDQADKTADGWNLQGSIGNPVIDLVANRGQNLNRNYNLNATAYLEIQPIKGLKYRGQFSYRMSSSSYRSFTTPYNASTTAANSSYSVTQNASLGHNISLENVISYVLPKLGGHSIDALIGQSFEKTAVGETIEVKNSVNEGSQLPTLNGQFDHAWITNTANVNSSSFKGEPWGDWAMASFFGRVNWNYNEKYMATAIIRADGSSNFARGNRWGYFPSVSAGWVISNENWMESTKGWMDFLKIRASWGQNGNQSISNFQYVSSVAFDKYNVYNFGSTSLGTTDSKATGGYAKNLPNPDVSWETSEQLNIGLDARFLNNRLGFAFDWYKKTTKDWLITAPIVATAGTGAPVINGGDVENKGFEIALNWNDNIGKDFRYGVNVNFSHNKNEVTRIANTEGIIHGSANVLSQGTNEMYRAQVGYPIGYFYGYQSSGVFQNQAEIDAWKAAGNGTLQGTPQPGDLIFTDRNHNGAINEEDKTMIGDPNPDYRLGFSINLAYKGFDFSVTANGAFGQQIAKSYRRFADSRYNNYTTDVFKRWHGEGTSNSYPRLIDGSNVNFKEISDIYIEDADFLRIQNITLGYDFKKLFPKMPLQQARLYVQVQNLYTFTGYSGLDPEVGYGYETNGTANSWVTGIDLGSYPQPRTVLVGANIKF